MKAAILVVLTFGFILCHFGICEDDRPAAKAESEWRLATVTLKYRGVLKGLVKDEPGQPFYLDYGTGPVHCSRSVVLKVEDLPDEEVEAVVAKLSKGAESRPTVEAVYAAKMRAAGKVPLNGKWFTPKEAEAEQARLADEAAKRKEEARLAAEAAQREEEARIAAREKEARRRTEDARLAAQKEWSIRPVDLAAPNNALLDDAAKIRRILDEIVSVHRSYRPPMERGEQRCFVCIRMFSPDQGFVGNEGNLCRSCLEMMTDKMDRIKGGR